MLDQINEIKTLQELIDCADNMYRDGLSEILLFNDAPSKWTKQQVKRFAAIFYHTRGHFIDFMWYLANFCHDDEIKKIVLSNCAEEFGVNGCYSHEMLYARFAKACGVDIQEEIIHQTHYVDFARDFNHGHIKWLSEHNLAAQFAAFSAYERLDNIDYPSLYQLAQNLGFDEHSLTFFKVHIHVEHFEATSDKLMHFWREDPEAVKQAFEFIYSHQLEMWRNLYAQVNAFVVADKEVAI